MGFEGCFTLPPSGIFEFQEEFEEGGYSVDGASTVTRPDAVVGDLWAMSFGPTALQDPGDGLLVKGWYVRADNTAGKVYLGESDATAAAWLPEVELFSYTGEALEEIDLTFDQNGSPVIATERAGHVWIRYFKPAAGANVFEDFGVGRTPRCVIDNPGRPSDSDILVFYIRDGALRYRVQNDLYVTETSPGITLTDDQYLQGTVRDSGYRLHVIVSTRDPVAGTWSRDRISSLLYPIFAEAEGVGVAHVSIAGVIDLLIREYEGRVEGVGVAHSTHLAELIEATQDEGLQDSLVFGVSVDTVTLFDLVISAETTQESVSVSHSSISGVFETLILAYAALTESVSVSHSSISGTLQGVGLVTSGLVVNHDAQALTGYADDDAVTTWPDESGSGNSMTAMVSSATYKDGTVEGINGHPALKFASTYFEYASRFMAAYTEGEVFVVLKNVADNSGYTLWWYSDADYSNLHPYTDGYIYESWGRATRPQIANPATPMTDPHLYNVSSKASEWTVRYDGAQVYQTLTNTPSWLSATFSPRFGRAFDTGGSAYYQGWVGQILIYDRVLSSSERAQVEAYLTDRWGL